MKSVTITIPAEHIHSVAQALKERAHELEEEVIPHLMRSTDGRDLDFREGNRLADSLNAHRESVKTLRGLATTLLITGAE